MNRRMLPWRAAVAALLVLGLGAPAGAADITLSNPWMRPTRAGAPTAAVYVDVKTDVPLMLVGASSPVAKSVVIMLVRQNPDGSTTETSVKEIDVPGGTVTRFAFNGNHIQLRDIQDNLYPGGNVPLTIEFVEPKGDARHSIEIGVLVRGVILPPPDNPTGKTN